MSVDGAGVSIQESHFQIIKTNDYREQREDVLTTTRHINCRMPGLPFCLATPFMSAICCKTGVGLVLNVSAAFNFPVSQRKKNWHVPYGVLFLSWHVPCFNVLLNAFSFVNCSFLSLHVSMVFLTRSLPLCLSLSLSLSLSLALSRSLSRALALARSRSSSLQ